ncbi:hypothetical protein [Flavivirga rizhaonensis]|uniref:Uncharacterized protein n=1 Tax=Flavivirga rizhaonensis TaxID=2559571 RepID=A0A4S1E1B8_9FLAO|nr:hypothetical protein [Flavivirga rizhaonensis]TGV04135.1 hypothetical protein EM932_03070 [Flavivirga rizhaonensis]
MKTSIFNLALFGLALIFIVSCSSDDSNNKVDDPDLTGDIGSVENIQIFPVAHPLNMDISSGPVDVNSDLIINNIGINKGLFPDFGSGEWEGAPIGIPYVSVDGSQSKVSITFRANNYDENYGGESDQGSFPIPLNAPIEGNGAGDSHVISVDVENGMLYELYNASQEGDGFEASSAAVFDLKKTEFRPDGWTSADAAGLPIFPLLVRYPEIEKGVIDHPIRFTITRSKIYEGYVHPARHLVSGNTSDELLPFGGRLRLKADYDISGFSETNQIILTAMKKYGLMLADVGSDMFITGAPHEKWDNDDLKKLKQVTLDNFEVIELGTITLKN